MKLITTKKYFDKIKAGEKKIDYRDAHLTFVCEETGETIKRNINSAKVVGKTEIPLELQESGYYDDEKIIAFELE